MDSPNPSRDEIARRARVLWEASGRPRGSDDDFWLKAERELSHEREHLDAISRGMSSTPFQSPHVDEHLM